MKTLIFLLFILLSGHPTEKSKTLTLKHSHSHQSEEKGTKTIEKTPSRLLLDTSTDTQPDGVETAENSELHILTPELWLLSDATSQI